ncbi:MAG: type I glutamate--ammonia ligase [candidate division Zixibacteria bacterium]|nr:type I glutamate--ammonia ligase [candidate division Zixibacteria bacterium]
MNSNIEKLLKKVKDEKYEYIDFKFSDIHGSWRHITIPAEKFSAKTFEYGIGVDGSSIGFLSVKAGDMILIPDPTFYFIDPFWKEPTLSIICDICEVEPVEPHPRNPRNTAFKAAQKLQKLMPGVDAMMGPEFEFYLFDEVRFGQSPNKAFYYLDSEEAEWKSRDTGPGGEGAGVNRGHQIHYKEGYHAAPPRDKAYEIRSYITRLFLDAGIDVKYHHHEVGGAAQQEIETTFAPFIEMADKSMLAKYLIKNGADKCGKSASFMPKPLFTEPGSGMHVHQFLAKDGKSIFYNESKPLYLSDIGRYYIGGILKHSPALLAFTNPSTNSYKRLIPGYEAPVRASYSVGNRTAAVRIPGYIKDPSVMRMEFRSPDATSNVYLAFAAMLVAGLDGIKNKIDPGEAFDGNFDKLTPRQLKKYPQMPSSLEGALDALEKDDAFLREDNVFADELINTWLQIKRQEVEQIKIRPHPWEFRLYYDV